ncbi:MAG: long-chain fatty acid--CoA ligase [Acidobacteriota bacterium]
MVTGEPRTINELFARSISRRAADVVMRVKRGRVWRDIIGSELDERVRNVALGLFASGVRRGDRVAMLAESCPEWCIVDYGILASGAVTVPIYPTQALDQVEFILRNCGARILFVSSAKLQRRIQSVIDSFKGKEALEVIVFEPAREEGQRASTDLASLESRGAEERTRQPLLYQRLLSPPEAPGPDDVATIIYTSGTTGEPKGVVLTHRNLVFDALSTGSIFQLRPDDVALSFLPLSHVFERTVLYIYMHFNIPVAFAKGVETVAEDIIEVKPTILTAVPRLFERIYATINKRAAEATPWQQRVFHRALKVGRQYAHLLDRKESIPVSLALEHRLMDRLVFRKWREAVGGRVRFFFSGGAALPPELAYIFLGAGVLILQGYGLTETAPVVAVNRPDNNRIGTIGPPIPGVKVQVAEDGELLVQGDLVMQGYYRQPEETERIIERRDDGIWFHTGDIGIIDPDGFIRITDRKKDLFKTSLGKYIAPQPIENSIRGIPLVEQVIVIGAERKYPAALIVPNFDALRAYADSLQLGIKDRAELVRHPRIVDFYKKKVDEVTRHLGQHEKIKKIALLNEEFTVEGGELTPTLKVRRKFVEEKHQQLIDALYPKSEVEIG